MSQKKHTEEQILSAVKQMEAGRKAAEVAREVGVSTYTIYAWKAMAHWKHSASSVLPTLL